MLLISFVVSKLLKSWQMKDYTKVITHKIMFVNFAAAASLLGWRFFEGLFLPIFGAGLAGVFTYLQTYCTTLRVIWNRAKNCWKGPEDL
jgi:hypothetical protein